MREQPYSTTHPLQPPPAPSWLLLILFLALVIWAQCLIGCRGERVQAPACTGPERRIDAPEQHRTPPTYRRTVDVTKVDDGFIVVDWANGAVFPFIYKVEQVKWLEDDPPFDRGPEAYSYIGGPTAYVWPGYCRK